MTIMDQSLLISYFLVSSLMCIELLKLSGQILFLGTFLRRIYSMSIPAFLCTGTQNTSVTAVIQCQIKHYVFLLVGAEWQFENFTHKTETYQLLVTQSTFSCFYTVENVLTGLNSELSWWIPPVSEPWLPSGKRNELHWLKCLLTTLKPEL